jgi:regulator of protease activity HflC (stomatin/prohibitin superfamily)
MLEKKYVEEKELSTLNGFVMLFLNIVLILGSIVGIVFGGIGIEDGRIAFGVTMLVVGIFYLSVGCPILFAGLKMLNPNEALVLTFFGNYYGSIKKDGLFWINPFCTAINTAAGNNGAPLFQVTTGSSSTNDNVKNLKMNIGGKKKISLKTMTLNNEKQKVNDALGNPIEIGVVVIWRITNTAKAVFNVDNYLEFLSIQSDSAIRNVSRLYPYDVNEGEDELSLRGSSIEVAEKLKIELQKKAEVAGIEIVEARITHLAYATEIAAVMLQRQQAAAIIDARKMIVEGAVGMVEMALNRLHEKNTVELDEERKAAMVSNLLVVLCANKEAQPIVNSGSIY